MVLNKPRFGAGILYNLLVFVTVILSLTIFLEPRSVLAQASCDCDNWICDNYADCGSYDEYNNCTGWIQRCTCAAGDSSTGSECSYQAPPGSYVCNDDDNLCAIGDLPLGGSDGDPATTEQCTVNLTPISPYMRLDDDPITMTATVNVISGAVFRTDFESTQPTVATVSPSSDNPPAPYNTLLTPVSEGTSLITAYTLMSDGSVCLSTQTATVAPSGPWWQVRDSDIQTNSSLGSLVPLGNYFGLPGGGGWPGVLAYGGTASFGSGNVSQVGWLANSISTSQRVYNYLYFDNQIPDDIRALIKPVSSQADLTGAVPDENGYEWYKFTGTGLLDMDISSVLALGARRVILLVDTADLNINANISLTTGFFLAIANQDINIDPAVTTLEGLYVADGTVSTGTLGPDVNDLGQDVPLSVRGSVAAYTGINLQRDLADNSAIPAEFFEYAPDQILLFPSTLGVRRINWKEVAP